jgi:predicted RNA-binding protein with RPS1 domain
MKEIECLIKNTINIDDKLFYVVKEKLGTEEHFVPINQIELFQGFDYKTKYFFFKEFNPNHNKTYLSIIHPKYTLGSTHDFEVTNQIINNEIRYFELKSDYLKPLTVKAFDWQNETNIIKCKVVGYKRGAPKLRNVDTSNKLWEIDETYLFQIHQFSSFENRFGNKIESVILKTKEDEEIEIKAGFWHNKKLWSYDDINCKVVGIQSNGLPKLIINDKRHPLYNIGDKGEFKIKGFSNKTLRNGSTTQVINLTDSENLEYEVLAFPNQESKLQIGSVIKCEIIDISYRVHLKQVEVDDPFYFSFEEIIDNSNLKKKYFDPFLNDENIKLNNQYSSRSGFWVFTYCNYLLPKLKNQYTSTQNLNEVLKIIELHTKFETWIINKGILQAINSQEERKQIKNSTLQIIENNTSEVSAISAIINFKTEDIFTPELDTFSFAKTYYFLYYNGLKNIDEFDFLNLISSIIQLEINPKDYYYLKRMLQCIHKGKFQYNKSHIDEYFITSDALTISDKKNISKYLNWLYIEIRLNEFLDFNEDKNIMIAQFYRLNSLFAHKTNLKHKLLFNAFFICSNPENKFELPIIIKNKTLEIDFSKLQENPNKIESSTLNNGINKAIIDEKHYQGYKLKIDNINGFLPTQNIRDTNLKHCTNRKIKWATNVRTTVYSFEFNFLIAEQLDTDNENFYSENILASNPPKIGEVIFGKVKSIVGYGVFVSTDYGDGLLHRSQITEDSLSEETLNLMFSVGDKIPVKVVEFEKNKLFFSLIELVGTEYEQQYYNLIKIYEPFLIDSKDNDLESNLDFKLELEKGHIFEQYAISQGSVEEKIKYLRFAKAFFSNTKNARSYLLNIYIEYFNCLVKLDNLLTDYSFLKYHPFREDVLKIKVQPKTLENFPESKNLLFFIEILNLFNSQNEEDLDALFSLTKIPIEENDYLLKTVAKNALANNLIISEIDKNNISELDSFTYKNLRRIREYISQGVLSVEEKIEDKLEKELKEKRIYWKNVIAQDEGEKLEFKATFITPIPNNEKDSIIQFLTGKIKKTTDTEKIAKLNISISKIKEESGNVAGIDKIIIHSALKTIAAFTNTKGGNLILGVKDDMKIFGLEQDYNSFKKEQTRDEFAKYFDSKIKDYFGDSFSSTLLEKEFLKFPEGDILIIKVLPSLEEVFLLKDEKGNRDESIYVRNLASSNKLNGIELSKFIKRKYRKQFIAPDIK